MHQELSLEVSSNSALIGEIYFAICKLCGSGSSLARWLMWKHDQKSLAEAESLPARVFGMHPKQFAIEYLASAYLSKYKGLDARINTADVALGKFKTSEEECAKANERIARSREEATKPLYASAIYLAQRKISRLLGEFKWSKVSPYFDWGPGATATIPRRKAQTDHKITFPASVTSDALPWFRRVVEGDLHWSYAILGVWPSGPYSLIHYAEHNESRIVTVPKSAKTQRVIAAEPTGNLFLQKGAGGYFRRVLKRVGVDLDDQSLNQRAAYKAVSDDLATLDLRGASDALCMQLVFELLPSDWFEFLAMARTPSARLPDGSLLRLEKFSSMGNGFTFELESLIFWALSSAVLDLSGLEGVVNVYGDDIIVPAKIAEDVIDVLGFAGFAVNWEKSFLNGEFFESCGRHYFSGYDVTPVYQKEVPKGLFEVIRLHNRLVRWCLSFDVDPNILVRAIARFVRGNSSWYTAPDRRGRRYSYYDRMVISETCEGDTGFIRPLETIVGLPLDRNRGFQALTFVPSVRRLPAIEEALLAYRLRKDPESRDLFGCSNDNCSYGDVEISEDGADDVVDSDCEVGKRWLTPEGVCVIR